MKVNDIDIKETFNADIVSFNMSVMQIENNIIEMDSSYRVVLGQQQMKPQKRKLVIDFYSEDDISNFTAEISSVFLLDIEDGYIYQCWLTDTPDISQEGIKAFTFTADVYAIKQKKDMTVVNFKGNKKITNTGNCEAEVIFKLSSNSAISDFKINDITCELKAGDPLIIDGIDKKIYYESEPDVSAFDFATMTSFPRLKRGENDITTSDATVDVTISYYPVFM